MAEEIDFENGRNSNFEGLMTLTLTFDPAIRHIVLQQSSTSTYKPNFIQIEETFCGQTDVRTDGRTDVRTGGRTFFPSILLGGLSEVDLKTHRRLRPQAQWRGGKTPGQNRWWAKEKTSSQFRNWFWAKKVSTHWSVCEIARQTDHQVSVFRHDIWNCDFQHQKIRQLITPSIFKVF